MHASYVLVVLSIYNIHVFGVCCLRLFGHVLEKSFSFAFRARVPPTIQGVHRDRGTELTAAIICGDVCRFFSSSESGWCICIGHCVSFSQYMCTVMICSVLLVFAIRSVFV